MSKFSSSFEHQWSTNSSFSVASIVQSILNASSSTESFVKSCGRRRESSLGGFINAPVKSSSFLQGEYSRLSFCKLPNLTP